ncbi:MAG: ethylbenzene dehydrogenase [Candidatus Abyssobacteria bacterium SURF_5]|uniref:Ethylbenzene dehydrogenase n=1 Tax=Abyssobacteria bacterium (strain SURF_5) TaxID=2093360 RepID=A0A3A4NZN2_ABYX5|nr:MAG: ethylbenzene dehydrogenase [Candidatus Abyssubacteria bacterium SURF_5]
MSDFRFTRRDFLKISGTTALALSLDSLGFLGGAAYATEKIFQEWKYSGWEKLHREEWKWDKLTYGTHLVDCYPGNCLWRVYTKDGIVWREEQAGKYPVIDATGPDWNPRGCQKGCSYSNMMYNPDRVKYPMKRVGARGEGKWKRISWDEAINEVAEHLFNAIQQHGCESIVFEPGPGNGGWIHFLAAFRLFSGIGATELDVNATIGDFNKGVYETFGKFQFCESCDAWYFGKLILIWHMNPVYTRIPSYHFISEARYNGSEVITIAPDYSPSAIHADQWIPVETGGDAALGLAVGQVLLSEGTYDKAFVKEQTDFPLLVRTDTKKFLRETDVTGKGLEDQFYFWDTAANQPVKAPRGTLKLPCDPALEGTYKVTLGNGKQVEVRPAFAIFKEMVERDYTPEKASAMCGVDPATIRELAHKAWKARGNVQILVGWNSAKYYHGDLMERAMCLLLALTGSVGNKGSGIRGWNESLFDGATALMIRERRGISSLMQYGESRLDQFLLKSKDPEITDEIMQRELERQANRQRMNMVPPAFLYYFHSNYRDTWNKKEWHCPSMKRNFDDYMKEAIGKGWWDGYLRPAPDQEPQVYCFLGTSPARKNRGWWKNIYPELWKKYKFIFTLETRWSTTALMADMVLPAAGFYEKTDTRFPTPHVPWLTLTEKAVPPPGEAQEEWAVCKKLAEKMHDLGEKKNFTKYQGRNGTTLDLTKLVQHQTLERSNAEETLDDALKLSVQMGTLPEGTGIDTLRKEGIIRFTGIGKLDIIAMHLATDIKPDEPIVPLTYHTGPKKIPYPTYNRRMTFYIDHDWFIEAGEHLPVHKDNPKMGGNYPLRMTSGHQRWSVHSIWITDDVLARTHQGRPFMFMNTEDAKKRGIEDGDLVRVHNDFDDFTVHVKLTSAARSQEGARPGQVMIYHAWEPYQFEKWKSYDTAIPGMIKWLDLAAGYGHLDYYRWNWCTQPIDRAVSVEVEKAAVTKA